jgi:hypothetical protein
MAGISVPVGMDLAVPGWCNTCIQLSATRQLGTVGGNDIKIMSKSIRNFRKIVKFGNSVKLHI